MKNKTIMLWIMIVVFASCKPDEPKPETKNDAASGQNITFKLQALVNGQAISWAMAYVTAAGDTVQFDKIKLILSDFVLEKKDGNFLTIPNAYAFVNFKDGRDSFILKNVPKGDYASIRFMLGLDSAINHSDPTVYTLDHPLSPALNEMHWGWSGGYIFNVIEGYYRNNGSNAGFSFHIANDANVRLFSFVQDFTVDKDKRVLMNLHADKYFSNVVNFSLKTDGSFSHSGDVDPIMDKFIKNLNGIFELKSIQ